MDKVLTPVEETEEEVFVADRNAIMKMKTAESPFKPVFMYDVAEGRPKTAYNAYVPKAEDDDSFLGRIKRDILDNLVDNPVNMAKSTLKGVARGVTEGVPNFAANLYKEGVDLTASAYNAPLKLLIANEEKVLAGLMHADNAETPEGKEAVRRSAQKIADLENAALANDEYADSINLAVSNVQKQWAETLDGISALKRDEADNALFYDLGSGATSLAGAVGLAFFTKNPMSAAKAFGLGAQSSFYNEMRSNGSTVSEALAFSIPHGAAQAALERVGVHIFVENMAVRGMGSAILRNTFSEAVQEASQQGAEGLVRAAAKSLSGTDVEAPESVSSFLYDCVYAGVLGAAVSVPVSAGGALGSRRRAKGAAQELEQAGMESDDARATAGYLVYNDRVGEFSNALSEAKATGNFDRALSVFTQYAETVENKTGKKFWSNLEADRKKEFLQSLIVPPQKYVADAAQIANDMTDPDTFDDPTPEGIAKNFAETLENYAASTEESISGALDRQLEAIAQAEEKTKRQRAVLDERQDLSSTDKKVIGDMLEAFNASVADKFGADAVSDLSIETRTPQVNAEKQEEFAERAGMYEYEQGLTRAEAERLAMRDVFGEEQSEADAFVNTYKSTQVYDDIPFFQNAYDEYVRDFEFDDTGFMKEIAALSQKPNKKKTAELRQKYGTDSKTVREAYEYVEGLRKRRALRNATPSSETTADRLNARREQEAKDRAYREAHPEFFPKELSEEEMQKGREEAAVSLSEDVFGAMSKSERETYERDYASANLRERRAMTASANLEYFTKAVLPEMQKAQEVKSVRKSDISGSLYIDGARVSDHSLPGKYNGDDGVILSGVMSAEDMRAAVLQEIDDAAVRNNDRKQRELFYQTVRASVADVSTAQDIKTVRAEAKRYLKEIVRKQDIVHPSLGEIRVSDKGIEEFIKYSSDIRKLALVPHLKELIETSTVGMRETPKHPRKDGIVSFIPLYNEAVIDGVPAKTETLIGVDRKGNLFYDVFLDERRGRRNSGPGTKSGVASTASDINITISEDNGKLFYQRAYAGSRVDYDRPSLEAIGSGEGHQAHGWGLYYALNRDVAEGYMEKLSSVPKIVDENGNEIFPKSTNEEYTDEDVWDVLETEAERVDYDIRALKQNLLKEREDIYKDAYRAIKDKKEIKKLKGQVHEVDIPEPPFLLDEDLPIKEQSPFVKEAVKNYFHSRPDDYIPVETVDNVAWDGRRLYKEVVFQMRREGAENPEKAASETLLKFGIRGITYDGAADGKCFVIFDDKDVNVVQKFYQTGIPEIDESRVYNSLPESLKNAVDFVFTAEPVKELTGNEFQKDKTPLVDKVVDYYAKEYDGKVNREGIGDVLLDRRAVKDSIAHGIGKNKAAAFAAVPEVIKNGVIFDETKNYDGYRNDRIVFIAPVSIDNEQYACEVVIKKNPDRTGFYLHEVEITKKLADVFKTAQHGTPASSNLIIARKIAEINSSFDKALSDESRFYQSEETARGAYDPSERILYLFKNADPSTIVHELGHHFTMQYIRLLRENGREAELKGILDWLGAKSADEITVEQWEKLADAFIVYTKEGFAPSSKLDDLFAALKKYLTTLYEKLVTAAGRLPEISDEVREFFDTMMTVDSETQTDFKELLKKSRDLREVVKGVLRGEALEVNGLSVDDVKALVRQLHARMPRAPQTLEQKIRRAGGIDIDFARSFDLIPLMGASDAKFGKHGLFRRNGAIADETQLTEFLKSEGYIQEAGSERETSAQWDEAVKVLENAGTAYSPADVQQMRDRENAEAAVRAAQEALSGIDYDALLEGLSAFRSVGAVAASKDMIRYIDGQLKRIQSETKRLNKKLVKEARQDAARAVRKEMKQQAKEERDTLKERQKEIVALIRSLPLENKDGLISSVNKAFTAKSLSDILEEVKAKAENYYETEKRRRLKAKIDNFVKKTRPKSTKNQKFDYERNKLFERLREYSKLTQEKAAAELVRFGGGSEGQSAENLLITKYLTFKSEGMRATSGLMQSLLFDLESAAESGRYAKEQTDFTRRWNLSNRKTEIAAAVAARAGKRGDKAGRFRTKAGNFYRAFTNIYSMLNSIGGKKLADEYGKKAELLSSEVDTAVFEKIRDFSAEALKVLGLKSYGDMLDTVADLKKKKVTLTYQIEEMDGATFETDALGLLDAYNAIKNKRTREDYARAFGSYELPDGSVRLTIEDLIDENLTAAQKEWADLMMETVNSYYDALNQTFISLYGTDLPKVENYWPATSEHYKETELEAQFIDAAKGNPSFIKERAKGGVIPRPVDVYSKFLKHVKGAENFTRMGVFYKDLRDTFNSLRVSTAIKTAYGDGVYRELMKLIDNLWAFNRQGAFSRIESAINAAVNNWVMAKISVNPSVYVTQLTGMLNYLEQVPVADYVKGFVEGLSHPKETAEYMVKNAPFLNARFAGGYNEALQRVLNSEETGYTLGVFSPKMKYNARNAMSFLVRLGDKQAIVYGGYAFMKYMTEKKGLSVEEAAKEFEFATLRAQSSGTAGSLSNFQASRSGLARLLLAFKNTPMQFMRKVVDAWDMYQNGDISAAEFAKIETIYIVVVNASFVLAKYLFNQALDALTGAPDDDDDEEKLLWDMMFQISFGTLDGIPFAGDAAKYLAKSATGQARYYDTLISMPVFDDLERAARKLGKKDKTVWDAADIMTPALEIMTAAPVGTAVRYAKRAFKEEE